MPHILPCLPATAPKKSQSVYEEFYRGMGFPRASNFILTQGHSAGVARGSWEAVKHILVEGELARWVKELMFVAISVDRHCMYCAAAHVACCRMLEVNPDWVAAAEQNNLDLISDRKLRAMIGFALKCARSPQTLSPADYSEMRSFGLKELEIVEIIGMAAFAVYANILADATAMQSDEMFEQL
jgi:uncharacterized peroxidase-related enzyme